MPTYQSALHVPAAVFICFLASAGIGAGAASAQTDSAGEDIAPRCVTLNNIVAGEVVSGHEILFELRDGMKLIATLARDCPQLKFHRRFTYDAVGGRLCEGEGRIVARGGETCLISAFTPVAGTPETAAAADPPEE